MLIINKEEPWETGGHEIFIWTNRRVLYEQYGGGPIM